MSDLYVYNIRYEKLYIFERTYVCSRLFFYEQFESGFRSLDLIMKTF